MSRQYKEYQAAWRKANPEKVAATRLRHYEKHVEERRAAGRERNRKRRLENPGYDAEVTRRYMERHPERAAESRKKYAETHREEIARRTKEWRLNNPEKVKELDRRKTVKNPNRHADQYAKYKDRMTAAAAKWRKENPEKAREILNKSTHKRRALKAASEEHYTLAEIRSLRKKIGGKCALCPSKGRLTVDHIMPLAKGGSNGIRNIQFLCKPCNSKKQAKDPIDFAQAQGFLL